MLFRITFPAIKPERLFLLGDLGKKIPLARDSARFDLRPLDWKARVGPADTPIVVIDIGA
jgi:hypothetical protein